MAVGSVDVQKWVNVVFFVAYSQLRGHILFVTCWQRRLVLTVALIWYAVLGFSSDVARAVLFHRLNLLDIWLRSDSTLLFHPVNHLG